MHFINKEGQLLYRLNQAYGNKASKIAGYIIIHINPITRKYYLHRKDLAHKFMCSIKTVNKGINLLKRVKGYSVINGEYVHISYTNPQVNRDADALVKEGVTHVNR